MFDLISGNLERPLRERSLLSKVVAAVIHGVILGGIALITLFTAARALPPVASMMAFVASAPAPPPPPPPPRQTEPSRAAPQPEKPAEALATPVEAPREVRPEPPGRTAEAPGGVEGGVESGMPGGVVSGMVGGVVAVAPPPPPPPAPPAPVRIGGQISAPALVRRVEPTYPPFMASAKVNGVVVLEAAVDVMGCVQTVKVLRRVNPVLDQAAIDALKQWQYVPLTLNGIATPFVLTVTFSFRVQS